MPRQSYTDLSTSKAVFDAYIDRSWRTNAARQRDKGVEFVIGRRENAYVWNLEGTKRIIDCGIAGGVHSLGHHNRAVADALRDALDQGRDTGLWAFPNAEYIRLQDLLAELAPDPALNRSLFTHASTMSIDVAVMFAFRMTGRRKVLAYRHGYHGHSGFAALVTGSLEEGILEHYNLPPEHCDFLPDYDNLDTLAEMMTDEIAALIIEPMQYESFAPGSAEFLQGAQKLCRQRGVIFVLDETRTGLGRSGRLWTAELMGLSPDILITGKGLSGGLYPVSGLLMREEIYDRCVNEHKFSYISSLGGNEIACAVARRVLEIVSGPGFLDGVNRMAETFNARLDSLCRRHGNMFSKGHGFGAVFTLQINDPDLAPALYKAVFDEGVLCHSYAVIDPCVLKFLPPLTIDSDVIDEIHDAVDRAANKVKA